MTTTTELTHQLRARGLAPKTAGLYANLLRRAEEFMALRGTTLDEAGPDDLTAFAETVPRTHSSLVQLRSALRHHFDILGRRDAPLWAVRPPRKPPMRCKAVEDDEAAALAATARARRDRKGLAVLFGLYGGLRRSEIAGIRWEDMTDDGWLRVIGKGDKTRWLPLHPRILEALAIIPAAAGPVFPGERGRACVSPATVWEWVREVSAQAGLAPIPPHRLRHTALATANDLTGDLRAVQELAGHARPETTAGYTRVQRKRLAAIVGAITYGGAA